MSFSVLTVRAPAKINIGLRVFPRRPDGFHDLVSIFQVVGLWDTLRVRLDPAHPGVCDLCGDGASLPEDNTLRRAYDGFCAHTGEKAGIVVDLQKVIPCGSGLGGGSSDGASLIRALDALCGTHLSLDSMDAIAASVGSDVFFFLHSCRRGVAPVCNSPGEATYPAGVVDSASGAAVVRGRGEKVSPLEGRRDLYFVLICPEVHSSTSDAFEMLDKSRNGGAISEPEDDYGADWPLVYYGAAKEWHFVNDFTDCVAGKYPFIRDAERDLTKHGSVFTSLTGSGSAVYGLFASQSLAQNAACQLAAKWRNCFMVTAV